MKNLTLKYQKAIILKKMFDEIVDESFTIKQNQNLLKDKIELIKQIGLYALKQAPINTKDSFQTLNYVNSVEFGNQSDRLLSQFLYASHYTKNGKIKIEIDSFLIEQLNNTKLDNIYINDLLFPFNSFYLNLNNFNYVFSNENLNIDINIKIEGVYVIKNDDDLEFTFLTNHKSLNFIRLNFPCDLSKLNDLISLYSVVKCNSNEELERYRGHPDEDEMLAKCASISYDLSELSHLVFSIILYLSSYWNHKKDRIIEKFEYSKLKKEHNKKNNAKKLAIKLANSENIIYLKMTDQETIESKQSKEYFTLKNLFLVRGHWRKQPIGKKENNLYKTIWIKPFWKGDGEIVGKRYKLRR
ncbi:MAG: hypothetical protein U9N59_14535 [Campylobacterota bacterium]|nr:hypothetical protein [Campylobacterota bacterium]